MVMNDILSHILVLSIPSVTLGPLFHEIFEAEIHEMSFEN